MGLKVRPLFQDFSGRGRFLDRIGLDRGWAGLDWDWIRLDCGGIGPGRDCIRDCWDRAGAGGRVCLRSGTVRRGFDTGRAARKGARRRRKCQVSGWISPRNMLG